MLYISLPIRSFSIQKNTGGYLSGGSESPTGPSYPVLYSSDDEDFEKSNFGIGQELSSVEIEELRKLQKQVEIRKQQLATGRDSEASVKVETSTRTPEKRPPTVVQFGSSNFKMVLTD